LSLADYYYTSFSTYVVLPPALLADAALLFLLIHRDLRIFFDEAIDVDRLILPVVLKAEEHWHCCQSNPTTALLINNAIALKHLTAMNLEYERRREEVQKTRMHRLCAWCELLVSSPSVHT